MTATGENSPNCSEEDFNNPVADNYFSFESIYNLCSEEDLNMSSIGKHWNLTKDTKKRQSENHADFSGSNNPMYNKHHSANTKEKMSKSNKNKSRGKGIPKSEDHKRKIAESNRGIKKQTKHPKQFRKGHIPWQKGKPGMEGEKNPAWKGGISFEPYCPKFNTRLKEKIRDRDNRTCQLCGVKENGRKLDVHHIHYDKPNCNPDLIALCQDCNLKANYNRDYYENLFMNKLIERGVL